MEKYFETDTKSTNHEQDWFVDYIKISNLLPKSTTKVSKQVRVKWATGTGKTELLNTRKDAQPH